MAGWNGSYRDNGLSPREADVGVSRRKDGRSERSRSRDLRDRVDGGGAGGSGQKRSRQRPVADREPGELSSGSGSDGPEVKKGDSLTSIKKRKFSPIIWDLEDDKPSSSANSRSKGKSKSDREEPVSLPPPLPLTDLVRQSMEHASPSEAKVSVDSPPERSVGDDQDPRQLEEEDEDEDDYVPARNISTSRWADSNNALEDDEVDVDTVKHVVRTKATPLSNTVDHRSDRKGLSTEIREIQGEVSLGSASKSSSEGVQKDVEVDKKEYSDVDIGCGETNDVASDRLSDTDSEGSSGGASVPEQEDPPRRSINMLQGCRSVDEYEWLNKIDEGTYGVVFRARDKKSGEIVALKKVKMEKEREGFPLTSLREINILLSLHHPSVVDVKEVVVGSSLDRIFMVMEYMEHDLKGLMETMKQPFSQSEVKCLMLQLLKGVQYLHQNWVLHRDLKTSNLLLNNRGELKICDFGLSRQYGIPLKPYTQLVVTLWYRAPELLLGAKQYSTSIDMWSLGCIMAELLAKEPLFSGKTEFDQLDKIFRVLGTPNEEIWPGFSKLPRVKVNFVKQPYNKLRQKFPPTSFSGRPTLSEAGFDLLNKLLTYDPEKRITAEDALNHKWFQEVPLPKSKDFMPTFPAQHAQDRRLRRIMKSPDPLEEQRRKELQHGVLGTGSLFG